MADHRDLNHQWYKEFDEKAMSITFVVWERTSEGDEEVEITVPAVFEVCDTCHGKGSHVNPSIDAHGISPDEFAEDPDFAEDYFSGAYDMPCVQCHGLRVVPTPDETRLTPSLQAQVDKAVIDFYAAQHDAWHERTRGY